MDAEPSPVEKDPNFTNSGADSASPEPHEGMEFGSEDSARAFYAAYARRAGFRVRISRYTRSRCDNSVISRLIVCSKEGTRVGCKAMLMVKKIAPMRWVVSKFEKEHNHGPVPPRKVEVRAAAPTEEEDSAERSNYSSDCCGGGGGEVHEPFEGGREVVLRQLREADRVPRPDQLLGPGSAPRVVTRIGCKTMIVVKKLGSGKRVVSRFEREHNHALVSKNVMLRLGYLRGRDKSRFKRRGGMLRLGYFSRIFDCFVQQVVLRSNQMCTREEGAVSEEIYDVAMSALKSPWMVWFQMAFQSITMLFKPSGWPDRGGRAAGVPYQPHFAVRLSRGIGSLGLCCLLHNLLVADLLRQRNDQLREVANDDRSSHHDDDREEVEEEEYEEEDECFDDLCEGLRKMSITARRSGFRSPRECTLDSSTATTTRRKSSRGRRLS